MAELLATEVPSTTADSFLPELAERLSNLARAGFDATLLVRSAALRDPYPMTTPPPPSGGASSISYRKRRTRTPPTPRQSQRLGATTKSHDQQPPIPRSTPPPAFGPSR